MHALESGSYQSHTHNGVCASSRGGFSEALQCRRSCFFQQVVQQLLLAAELLL